MRLNLATGVLEPVRFDENLFAAKPAWSGSIEWRSDGIEVLEEALLRCWRTSRMR